MDPESEAAQSDGAEEVVYQSVVDGLRDTLGESGMKMVLSLHPLERIWTDPEAFHAAMKDIFMEEGATIIEREVARRILDRLGGRAGFEAHGRRWRRAGYSSGVQATWSAASGKDVLRGFVAMGGAKGERTSKFGWSLPSIEVTSMRFASAFRKGG